MKRASYREAVRWIADNDSAGCVYCVADCAELITSAMEN